jgi:enoyl-CoA hydratase/carnithine racemase
MSQDIIYEAADAIATITLNRPDRRNAQNQKLGYKF